VFPEAALRLHRVKVVPSLRDLGSAAMSSLRWQVGSLGSMAASLVSETRLILRALGVLLFEAAKLQK
jgi:hypothetical protein